MPRKRVGSGILLRDVDGRVLLVEPTYKSDWEIPGGLVEDGEAPREAARREVTEELGVEVEVGQLLCVHYCLGPVPPDDGVMFVFDGGMTTARAQDFVLPPAELKSAQFISADDLGAHLVPRMHRRILGAIDAAGAGRPVYLEH
jgi:8-oxo-dGTP pyrophosphatase MutT (NUDIX family)